MRSLLQSLIFLATLIQHIVATSYDRGHYARAPAPPQDTCAVLNNVPLRLTLGGTAITVGNIGGCLCLSTVPTLLSTNAVAITGSLLGGPAPVTAALTSLIQNAPGSKVCTYPENSTPICEAADPCSFTCPNGLSKIGSDCGCLAPSILCGGSCAATCGSLSQSASVSSSASSSASSAASTASSSSSSISSSAPNAVITPPASSTPDNVATPPSNPPSGSGSTSLSPSQIPFRRRLELEGNRLAQSCARKGLTLCGAPHAWKSSSTQPYECIDTLNDLESCGGCILPYGSGPANGTDCTAILGVEDVLCATGSCHVRSCVSGYAPSADRTICIRENAIGAVVHQMFGYF